jgi:hypothetical protein
MSYKKLHDRFGLTPSLPLSLEGEGGVGVDKLKQILGQQNTEPYYDIASMTKMRSSSLRADSFSATIFTILPFTGDLIF